MKENPQSANIHISDWLSALAMIAQEVEPFLPESAKKMQKILDSGEPEILFPRMDVK